ncbi:MAG: phage holin family protein [Mycoplasmoidaceae bacterium]
MYINEKFFNSFIATTGTVITFLLGDFDLVLIILICFMILDYITGLLRAYINKEISSNIGLKGITRKGLIFIIIIIAVLLDRLINDSNFIFRTLVSYFYISNEAISILENSGALGLPIPEKIKEALAQLKEGQKNEKIK